MLIVTGNAPYNGSTDFGDSLIELTLPGLHRRQAYTPVNQAQLNSSDTDLGSGSPAVLPGGLVLIGGKDGLLRVLDLAALDGRRPGGPARTGGQLQLLPDPGRAQLFSTPAVWHDLVFVADGSGTAAYRVGGRRLHMVWQNGTNGTSPIVAGGLLYVYDMDAGGLAVYQPASGKLITTLPVPAGHWNSPIAVDGHVIEPTGDGNAHATSGQLVIFSMKVSRLAASRRPTQWRRGRGWRYAAALRGLGRARDLDAPNPNRRSKAPPPRRRHPPRSRRPADPCARTPRPSRSRR